MFYVFRNQYRRCFVIYVLFVINTVFGKFTTVGTVSDDVISQLYSKYREAVEDDSSVSMRRLNTENHQFKIHVEKLKSVNAFKLHNLEVKEVYKNNPLIYIDNPVESKIPHAYLTLEEFKQALTNRIIEQREGFKSDPNYALRKPNSSKTPKRISGKQSTKIKSTKEKLKPTKTKIRTTLPLNRIETTTDVYNRTINLNQYMKNKEYVKKSTVTLKYSPIITTKNIKMTLEKEGINVTTSKDANIINASIYDTDFTINKYEMNEEETKTSLALSEYSSTITEKEKTLEEEITGEMKSENISTEITSVLPSTLEDNNILEEQVTDVTKSVSANTGNQPISTEKENIFNKEIINATKSEYMTEDTDYTGNLISSSLSNVTESLGTTSLIEDNTNTSDMAEEITTEESTQETTTALTETIETTTKQKWRTLGRPLVFMGGRKRLEK